MSRHSSASHFHKSKTLNDKYLLGDEIGKGAYGRVYKGLDLENGDFVAIKQVSLENIPPEDLASIMQEIDLLKNLNHKNIVKYQGSFKTKTHLYIILEYVENGSLANIIKPNKFGAFPESLVAVYIAQVLEGLVYLHEQGVIHRDIKGANILTTKEGLVKLADFGVATKLTEADVNTHSVVGTPYWMAPEVIEMSGVSAASDIWSVGCTVIELLTCVPPYYDLQPMPALFRIVQDDHPPIPEHVSAAITDFLHQCFRKDAKLRPDARTLLKHSWIRNTRRSLQSSLQRTGGKINNVPQDVSTVVERTIEDGEKEDPRPASEEASTTRDPFDSGSDDDQKTISSQRLGTSATSSSQSNNVGHRTRVRTSQSASSVQQVPMSNGSSQPNSSGVMHPLVANSVARLALNNSPALDGSSSTLQSPSNMPGSTDLSELSETSVTDMVTRNAVGVEILETKEKQMEQGGYQLSPESSVSVLTHTEEDDEVNRASEGYGQALKQKDSKPARSQSNGSHHPPQVGKLSAPSALKRFIDTPADGQFDDLWLEEPFVNNHSNPLTDVVGTSTPGPAMQGSMSKGTTRTPTSDSGGSSGLAAKLRERMAQKRVAGEAAVSARKDLFQSIIDVEDDESIDITPLGFVSKEEGRDYLAKQAMEITRLVSLLKPDESEEAVISACQKLVTIFQEYPEQKAHLVSQHGIIPLVEMLEVNNNRVLYAVLQLLNQIIRDNVDFQENACLVGLIPMIMSFASPERAREMRMQAAAFVQQICLTSTLTLQMFIACRGLPVLVSFLEPDYSKYREMVHMAIDAMWQVFDLQNTTTRNDFCRLFAKSGVLVRLVNTLYSLNEATRLASVTGPGGSSGATFLSAPGPGQVLLRSRSGPLEQSRATHAESFKPRSGQLDPARVRAGYMEQHRQVTGLMESSRPKSPQSHKSAGLPEYLRHLPGQLDQGRGNGIYSEAARMGASFEGGNEIPLESPARSVQFSGDRDLASVQIDSPRVDTEHTRPSLGSSDISRAPFTDQSWHSPRIGNGSAESAHHDVQPLLSLLEKEPPSRPGQPDYYRHVSSGSFERSDSALPLLHHAAAIRKVNGKQDAHGTVISGLPSMVSPTLSGHISAHAVAGSYNYGDAPSSSSGSVSQRDSGHLSSSVAPNAKPGNVSSPGQISRMVTLNAEVSRDYVAKVADLLLEFSRADTVVKSRMCTVNLLIRLFQMLNKLAPVILVKILRCIKELSTDPFTLEFLQRADAMKHLVPFLEVREGPYVSQIHNQVLNALYNLCKINKRRQEQAAESGIIPHLMYFIRENSPLNQFALPLLCDMAHASRYTREQLRAHKGLEVYLSLLKDDFWAVTALDSLAVCLAHDNDQRKVEQALLTKDALQKLVAFFQSCSGPSFVHILEPFLKIITKSVRLNTALAVSGLTPLLVGRLDHQDAIVRLNLLKLIKAVYEHHPRPKQLIVEHDLPLKLRKLIEERRDGERSGGQVLVKQMATALLKALHINTVL